MITYTSKKTLFVITALLCGLFTSIRMAVACRHIHVHTQGLFQDFARGGGGGGGGGQKHPLAPLK